MKKTKNTNTLAPKTLNLNRETVKLLTEITLKDVQGGLMHTSFSCGNNLCTTHGA